MSVLIFCTNQQTFCMNSSNFKLKMQIKQNIVQNECNFLIQIILNFKIYIKEIIGENECM